MFNYTLLFLTTCWFILHVSNILQCTNTEHTKAYQILLQCLLTKVHWQLNLRLRSALFPMVNNSNGYSFFPLQYMNIIHQMVQNHENRITGSKLFRHVTPCNLTDGYHHVGETFYHEDGGYSFLRNVCTCSLIWHHTTQDRTLATPTGHIAGSDIMVQICLHAFVSSTCTVSVHRCHSALMLKVAYVNTTVWTATVATL